MFWLISHDIREGRCALNFSTYDEDEKLDLLAAAFGSNSTRVRESRRRTPTGHIGLDFRGAEFASLVGRFRKFDHALNCDHFIPHSQAAPAPPSHSALFRFGIP